MTAVAEFAGHDRTLTPARLHALDEYARKLCGDNVDVAGAQYWAGLRPSTPASTPYIGRLRAFENLWINAGHGQLGWTMAAGCGSLIAQLVAGEKPDITDISSRARWLVPF